MLAAVAAVLVGAALVVAIPLTEEVAVAVLAARVLHRLVALPVLGAVLVGQLAEHAQDQPETQ
jgi:hypothetical protein